MTRMSTDRAGGLLLICAVLLTSGSSDGRLSLAAAEPILRLRMAEERPEVVFLSWDTEGGDKVERNLLRSDAGLTLRLRSGGQWLSAASYPARIERVDAATTMVRMTVGNDAELSWKLATTADSLTMTIAVGGSQASAIEAVEICFPFDPGVTPTTVLPSRWLDDGTLRLPAVLSAPDFGQMLLADAEARQVSGRLEGSRAEKTVDFVVDVTLTGTDQPRSLTLTPLRLPAPAGLQDTALWAQARRGWFGAWQPSARWGDQNRPFSAPPGVLANNVISDPASCSLWFYADQAFWTPQITPDISVAQLVRRSVDFWLLQRTRPTGEVVCYWDYGNFLDANAGPLIAAWDYVESTGDTDWLQARIERLELVADFLAKRDVDNDGMVEAVQSGNRGTLQQPARSCAWFDALNCGHKDGYTNALIYRAWRCLADLEQRLGRTEQAARYHALGRPTAGQLLRRRSSIRPRAGSRGGRVRMANCTTTPRPSSTGWLSNTVWCEPAQGREILARLWQKMDEVGFDRFDLGVPPMLVPVRRDDYLLPDGLGIPQREDGTRHVGPLPEWRNHGRTGAAFPGGPLRRRAAGEGR